MPSINILDCFHREGGIFLSMHHLLVLLHHLPYKDQKKQLQVGNAKIAQLTPDLFPFNPQHPFVQTQATVDRKRRSLCMSEANSFTWGRERTARFITQDMGTHVGLHLTKHIEGLFTWFTPQWFCLQPAKPYINNPQPNCNLSCTTSESIVMRAMSSQKSHCGSKTKNT